MCILFIDSASVFESACSMMARRLGSLNERNLCLFQIAPEALQIVFCSLRKFDLTEEINFS